MSEADTAITTGELSRAVNLIRGDIKEVKKDISERPTLTDFVEVKAAVEKRATIVETGYLHTRIKALEDWQTWAMRLGVPALLAIVYNVLSNVDKQLP